MSERLIIPPAALAVSLEAARRQARVDVDENGVSALDDDIQRAVRAYTRDAEHETGRAFVNQTWELSLDAFPAAIRLGRSPVVGVSSVQFYDLDGVLQQLDPQDYLADTKSEPGWIVPAPGRTWPATAARIHAVEVQYVCGYGDDDTFVPAEAAEYILARVQQKFAPVSTSKLADLTCLLDGLVVYG